ncbi:hypothetical protein [Agrobacterium rosae]|uniref:hypothetical protein n=1 Tax=Agrobacterium rosae TaxID=1972867 RepID=UPI001178B3A2|nr:hypothetical protein [Agrobacterium rosae]
MRHRDRLQWGAGQFPLDGSEKALRRARSPRRQSQEAAAWLRTLHGLIVEDPDLGQEAIDRERDWPWFMLAITR